MCFIPFIQEAAMNVVCYMKFGNTRIRLVIGSKKRHYYGRWAIIVQCISTNEFGIYRHMVTNTVPTSGIISSAWNFEHALAIAFSIFEKWTIKGNKLQFEDALEIQRIKNAGRGIFDRPPIIVPMSRESIFVENSNHSSPLIGMISQTNISYTRLPVK